MESTIQLGVHTNVDYTEETYDRAAKTLAHCIIHCIASKAILQACIGEFTVAFADVNVKLGGHPRELRALVTLWVEADRKVKLDKNMLMRHLKKHHLWTWPKAKCAKKES